MFQKSWLAIASVVMAGLSASLVGCQGQSAYPAPQLSQVPARPAYVGVGTQPFNSDYAARFRLPPGSGVVVTAILPNSPAERAGLLPGDVIVTYAGRKVTYQVEFLRSVEASPVGTPQRMVVARDGKYLGLIIRPEERPMDFPGIAGSGEPGGNPAAPERDRSEPYKGLTDDEKQNIGLGVAPLMDHRDRAGPK